MNEPFPHRWFEVRRFCALDVFVRFAEAFQLQHAKNLAAAEERSMKLYMEGNMPAAKGKKMLKPMTEVSPDQFLAAGATFSQGGRDCFLSLSVSRIFTTAIALDAHN